MKKTQLPPLEHHRAEPIVAKNYAELRVRAPWAVSTAWLGKYGFPLYLCWSNAVEASEDGPKIKQIMDKMPRVDLLVTDTDASAEDPSGHTVRGYVNLISALAVQKAKEFAARGFYATAMTPDGQVAWKVYPPQADVALRIGSLPPPPQEETPVAFLKRLMA